MKPISQKLIAAIQQRHAGVVEPAQRAGGDRLHAVGDEEGRADQQQRAGKLRRLRHSPRPSPPRNISGMTSRSATTIRGHRQP